MIPSALPSSSRTSSSQKLPELRVDPKKVFLPQAGHFYDWATQQPITQYLFLVPVSLCPDSRRQVDYLKTLDPRARERAALSLTAQKEAYQAEFPDHQIIFVRPEKVKGRIVLNGCTPENFRMMFKSTPNQIFKETLELKTPSPPNPSITYSSQTAQVGASSLRIERQPSVSPCDVDAGAIQLVVGVPIPPIQMLRLQKVLKSFFLSLANQIQQHSKAISPYERLGHLPDILAQSIIDESSLKDEQKQSLSKSLFYYYERFFFSSTSSYKKSNFENHPLFHCSVNSV